MASAGINSPRRCCALSVINAAPVIWNNIYGAAECHFDVSPVAARRLLNCIDSPAAADVYKCQPLGTGSPTPGLPHRTAPHRAAQKPPRPAGTRRRGLWHPWCGLVPTLGCPVAPGTGSHGPLCPLGSARACPPVPAAPAPRALPGTRCCPTALHPPPTPTQPPSHLPLLPHSPIPGITHTITRTPISPIRPIHPCSTHPRPPQPPIHPQHPLTPQLPTPPSPHPPVHPPVCPPSPRTPRTRCCAEGHRRPWLGCPSTLRSCHAEGPSYGSPRPTHRSDPRPRSEPPTSPGTGGASPR